jgi:hypothetical protein
MASSVSLVSSTPGVWGVLTLFLIPIGGGIPAGVLLARSRHIDWPVTMALYFLSDVILACLFEPLMLLVIAAGKRAPFLARLTAAIKTSMKRTSAHYGSSLGPLALIMVAFGVDPMTGRAAAVAAGHGFVTGWMLAIAGDMLYFVLLMVSTLWLNNILGDGTWTTIVILLVMMIVPVLVRRFRQRKQPGPNESPQSVVANPSQD